MSSLTDLLSILLGVIIIIYTLFSAIRTFVLPRGEDDPITRWTFNIVDLPFALMRRFARSYEARDRIMALYGPLGLLTIPLVWVVLIINGYALIYWGMGIRPYSDAVTTSGSSLLTLGTVPFRSFSFTLVMFSQATIGLGIIALLLAYLPTIYNAFSRRESLVSMLEVRAGSGPRGQNPSAAAMIVRLHRIGALTDEEAMNELWKSWEHWFTELEESHTSLASVVFFRSQQPHRSWVTAAGTVLDSTAIILAAVDLPQNSQAQLMMRSGYIALRSISAFFRLPYNDDPAPTDPISISKDEFLELYDTLLAGGIPVKADRDQAWRDYAGWRVNYDQPLLQLAALTMAPYAPWISDRSLPKVYRRKRGKP